MNSRDKACRPGSGRVVDLEATNGRVPQSHHGAIAAHEKIPFKYRKTDNLFYYSNIYRAGTLTGKRERILEGMLEAVGRKGYEQTTVQDAIEAAGLYRQAFYDSFNGKEDCYLQALDAGAAWVESVMRDGVGDTSDWRGQLRGSLRGLLGFLDTKPHIGRALLVEVHAAGPRAVARRTEAMARAADLIDLARAESDGDAPAISAEAVVAGILAVLHTRLAGEQHGGFEPLLPELMYLAVLPYFGAEAAADQLGLDTA
jgi:AcrR family transcriptional regulator